MPLEVPNLDVHPWAELVDEARALIPRVSPPWTDHNFHDPGITFIELFAWLAEMQLYQLNRVGPRQREEFGQLVGVSRGKRTPARVSIRAQGMPNAAVFVPAGTQLVPTEGQEIVFETDTDLFLTRTLLRKVITNDGSGPVDQTQANQKTGIAFLAFGETASKNAELRLGFDHFYPGEQPEISLTANIFTDDLGEQCGTESPIELEDGEDDAAPVNLVWEYLGAGAKWFPLQVINDRTATFSRTGSITLGVPKDAVPQLDFYWIRARIRDGFYDIEPRLRSISLNVLPCSQKQTVQNEQLGEGNGKPDQSFELLNKPVLVPEAARRTSITSSDVADWNHLVQELTPTKPELAARLHTSLITPDKNGLSAFQRIKDLNQELTSADDVDHLLGQTPVVVEVDNEIWSPVSSFKDSGPESKHYICDPETGVVEFGNGLNGQVPKKELQVRAVWYQASTGGSGKVAKDLTWKFRTAAISGFTLTNPEPGTAGTDPEPLDQLELRTRALLNRPQRAVTLNDLEVIALSTPNACVSRAKALTDCPEPDSITVVAFPKVRPGRKGPPKSPSPLFLNLVQRNLQGRRLLCDKLRVVPPVYVEVKVLARLRLSKGAGQDAVVKRAREAIDSFLAGQLQPSDQVLPSNRRAATQSSCLTRWPFGRSVFPSEVYAILDGVAGVDFASDLVLTATKNGVAVPPNQAGAIPLPPIGLVFPGEHNFTVEFDTRRNG